jgi:hypothetical protein
MNENKTGAGGRRRVSYIINKLFFFVYQKIGRIEKNNSVRPIFFWGIVENKIRDRWYNSGRDVNGLDTDDNGLTAFASIIIFLDMDSDTNMDQIFDEYPDMDQISDRYKYEYGYISDIK